MTMCMSCLGLVDAPAIVMYAGDVQPTICSCPPIPKLSASMADHAAQLLMTWALQQARLRDIMRRPFGIFPTAYAAQPQVQIDACYYDPEAVAPPL